MIERWRQDKTKRPNFSDIVIDIDIAAWMNKFDPQNSWRVIHPLSQR